MFKIEEAVKNYELQLLKMRFRLPPEILFIIQHELKSCGWINIKQHEVKKNKDSINCDFYIDVQIKTKNGEKNIFRDD